MKQEPDDEKLEAYLRQFRLRNPPPLTQPHRIEHRNPLRAIAAVAALVVITVLLLFFQQTRHSHPQPIAGTQSTNLAAETSLASFNRILRKDPEKLEGAMNSLSPRLLPDVQRSRGVLKILARE